MAKYEDVTDANNEIIASRINENFKSLLGEPSMLTIASGIITITNNFHKIETEGGAASDDLNTINGGVTGQILVLMAYDSAHTVILKDNTGNLKLSADITLDESYDTATLIFNGTFWCLLASSNNGE